MLVLVLVLMTLIPVVMLMLMMMIVLRMKEMRFGQPDPSGGSVSQHVSLCYRQNE